MKPLDSHGKPLSVGNEVLYLGTHTYGRVEEISITDNVNWVKIDTTGLYYRSEYLEITKIRKSVDNVTLSKEERIKQKITRSKQTHLTQEGKISDHPDGPGYGGG
ncbi:MAG: DUF2098 family protein [Methanobacteriaceae archaeon]|jgi:hypothetical protein